MYMYISVSVKSGRLGACYAGVPVAYTEPNELSIHISQSTFIYVTRVLQHTISNVTVSLVFAVLHRYREKHTS